MFKSKIACVALYKVSTPFCEEEASLVRAAARQKHQFYGERIKPQTSHANPKLKFTKVWLFCTVDLSQSSMLYFSSIPQKISTTPGRSAFKPQYFILNVECSCVTWCWCDDKCCDPSKNPRTVTNDARAAAGSGTAPEIC